MSLDTSFYHWLSNEFLGPDQVLAVAPGGSRRLRMSPKGSDGGQLWRLVDRGNGEYWLRTKLLGDCFSLDVVNDGRQDTPRLASTGDSSGQVWSLTPLPDGTYRLTNDFAGPDRSLDTASGTYEPRLAPGDHSGQHWALSQSERIESDLVIPCLDPMGDVDQGEGPTDFSFYARPEGIVRCVMIFVDFRDAKAGSAAPADVACHLLGDGAAQRLFHEQSHQRLTLEIVVRSDLGWRSMAKESTEYSTHDSADSHREYVAEAAALFSADVTFSEYSLVLVATTRDADLQGASSFTASDGVATASGAIRLAATFDGRSHARRYMTLVHELGHLFGLPDLYPNGRSAACSSAGCWSIMSDVFHATGFLGWHRHKNGWLPPARKTYIAEPTKDWVTTLHPLSGPDGLSMIVLPVDDPVRPSKIFVLELAQKVRSEYGEYWGEGVLLYTVDATVPSGFSPVVVIPKTTSHSADFGFLWAAPYGVGDSKIYRARKASVNLLVERKVGDGYQVRIGYERQ